MMIQKNAHVRLVDITYSDHLQKKFNDGEEIIFLILLVLTSSVFLVLWLERLQV